MPISPISRSPITFQARLQESNKHFAETLHDTVTRLVFSRLNKFVSGIVVPASKKDPTVVENVCRNFERLWDPRNDLNRFLKQNFTPSSIEVTTPDGVKLRGTFFKHTAASETAPTVIFFQPNAMMSKQGGFDWVLRQAALQEFHYNFVYFDYRGCGESEGEPRLKKNLFLDGESIYQFVRDKLRVPAKDIHFYGYSLGAGVSANVKAIHPECEGNHVNERSFTSIHHVVGSLSHYYANMRLTSYVKNAFKWIVIPIITSIAYFALSLSNWNIESTKAIANLKGKTLIVHHPQDELMQRKASLYQTLFQRGILPSPNIKDLDLSRSPFKLGFIHGTPLELFTTENFNAEEKISKFIFSSPSSFSERMLNRFIVSSPEFQSKVFETIAQRFQSGGFYWGSAADAFYNRNGLSLTDEMRIRAIVTTKWEAR